MSNHQKKSIRAVAVGLGCLVLGTAACSQLQSKASGVLGGSPGSAASSGSSRSPAVANNDDAKDELRRREREREDAEAMMQRTLESNCLRVKEDNDPAQWKGQKVFTGSLEHHRSAIANAQEQYLDLRAKAFQANPDLASSTKTFKAAGKTFATGETLKTCDPWFGEALKQYDALIAASRGREQQEEKDRGRAQKEADAVEAKWAKALKGDRKALQSDRGWPNESDGGDQWARIVKARWWMYGTNHSSERNDFLCKETIYFEGDKIAKRSKSGRCQ
jgi:hypothetical protein